MKPARSMMAIDSGSPPASVAKIAAMATRVRAMTKLDRRSNIEAAPRMMEARAQGCLRPLMLVGTMCQRGKVEPGRCLLLFLAPSLGYAPRMESSDIPDG